MPRGRKGLWQPVADVTLNDYFRAQRKNPSRFEHLCRRPVPRLLTTIGWPVTTVAIICVYCGHVLEYVDDFEAAARVTAETKRPPKDNPLRPWFAHRGVAVERMDFDDTDRQMMNLLKTGMTAKEVAIELNLPPLYVIAMARLAHIV